MIKIIAGVLIGAGLGYLYHKVIGCPNGSCPITANAWSSILYGGVLGFLLSNNF